MPRAIMQLQRSSLLIPGLFALLLVHLPAEAQSFGSATWIRQAWTAVDGFIPMDITIGPHEEVFVTGKLRGEKMPGLRLRRTQRMSACWTRHTMVPGFWFDTMARPANWDSCSQGA